MSGLSRRKHLDAVHGSSELDCLPPDNVLDILIAHACSNNDSETLSVMLQDKSTGTIHPQLNLLHSVLKCALTGRGPGVYCTGNVVY
jgi:hypothetical protein